MDKIELVDLKRQLFGDKSIGTNGIKAEIDAAISKVVNNTAFTMGAELNKFESKFAEYCGAKYCIGLNSGTDALEFALRCNGITSGKVITAPNSYFTTSSSINSAGCTPVFVDVDPRTYNIDTSKLEKAIDNQTKALIIVHLYGRPANMDEIGAIAKKYKLLVIEDCAHAPGAEYKGKKVPILGTGAFSFFPGKNIGAWGDGGALVTNNENVARMARLWRNDGWENKYHHEIIGRKARLDNLQAAILAVKLDYLERWNESRRKCATLYNSLLADIKEIQLPLLEDKDTKPIFHIYNILTDRREELMQHLARKNISTGIHYPIPIHLQQAYNNMRLKEGSFPVAERLAKETLSLPIFPELRKDEIEYVCDSINEFFGKKI